jgi:hypothetical protein
MRIQDIKTRPTAKIEIPVQLSRLRDMIAGGTTAIRSSC